MSHTEPDAPDPLTPGTGRALDLILAHAQRDARLPSVVAGIVRDGDPLWTGARGDWVRNTGSGRPTADTQYKIGSVTKTMTATLALLARERGELRLSDQVRRFLPEAPYAEATLRQLLTHSAGITAEPRGSWWERSEGVDVASLLAAHAGDEPVLEVGSQLHYSNLGYGLLGAVLEQITGQAWWQALRQQVLEPLGMRRTSFAAEQPAADGFSVEALTDELTVEPLPDTAAMAPAGQLWSTVDDLCTWTTALLDPERSVLSAESLATMRIPQVGAPEDRTGASWGLGITVLRERGRLLIGHGGSMPGFVCGLIADVDARTGAVVLSNGAYGLGDVTNRLLSKAIELHPPFPTQWRPTTDLPEAVREIVGVWHWGNAPSQVRWSGGELLLEPLAGPGRRMAFTAAGDDTWVGTRGYLAGETLHVVRREDGSVSHLEGATFVYTRQPYDPSAPIPGGAPTPRG